jgi:hypothetical protein
MQTITSAEGQTVTVIFILLTHLFILASIITMFVFIWHTIIREKNKLEQIIRISAFVTGFLVYFGARATGFSIPEMMLVSITSINKWVLGLKAILFPAAAGTTVGWFCVKSLNRGLDVATRIVILLATFIMTVFTDVYARTYDIPRVEGEFAKALLPNLSFTVGLTLYVIFRFTPRPASEAAQQFHNAPIEAPNKTEENEKNDAGEAKDSRTPDIESTRTLCFTSKMQSFL